MAESFAIEGSGATYLVDIDNENNAMTGVADGDMGGASPPFIYDTDALHPIEFNINVSGPTPSTSAELLIEAWDVDETSGQIDHVYWNGTFLGPLTGADGQWSTTSFSLPPASVLSGINRVQIVVDESPPGTNDFWGVSIGSGQLLVDGGAGGDASCRTLTFAAPSHELGGAPLGVNIEVDTAAASQAVRVEVNVLDPNGINLAGRSLTGTITGTVDDPFQTTVPVVDSGASGTYQVEALVFDVASGLFQDRCEQPLTTVPACDGFGDLAQPMGLFESTYTSDSQVVWESVEDFVDANGTIAALPGDPVARIRFWGMSLEWTGSAWAGECLTDNAASTPFDVAFYTDAAGAPDTSVDNRVAVPSEILDTGLTAFGAKIFRYTATLDPPVDAASARWMSIRRQTGQQAGSGNDCYFLWASESDQARYDNFFFQRNVTIPTVNENDGTGDLTLCIDAGTLFADGFESGNTEAWSGSIP